MREIIEKLGFIKIKNFFSVKDNGQRMRRQATDWGKIFGKDTFDTGLQAKICKELLMLNIKKTNHLILKWAKDLKKINRWQFST